jgi:hypothetical protein
MSPKSSARPPLINSIGSLRDHLQIAIQIEHYTIPPYLCALYSIKDGSNREARDVIQTVVMEEMLHMSLAANLLIAVGGSSKVNHRTFIPVYPSSLPCFANPFPINLRKFSKPALDTFIEIELPEPAHVPPAKAGRFSTIGQFYDEVVKGLEWLCKDGHEATVFSGTGRQITPEYYYGGAGRLFEIKKLDDAKRAITEIKEQGEALPHHIFVRGPGPTRPQKYDRKHPEADPVYTTDTPSPLHVGFNDQPEPAHYFRFKEIREGRYYQRGDTPKTGPRGPEFPVEWDGAWNMQDNPKSRRFRKGSPIRTKMDAFNASYSRLLDHLHEAFTGSPERLIEAVGDMFEIKHRGTELMRVPNELPGLEGTTVGPSFEYLPVANR